LRATSHGPGTLCELAEEIALVAGLIKNSIVTNAITALDQDEYAKIYERSHEHCQDFLSSQPKS